MKTKKWNILLIIILLILFLSVILARELVDLDEIWIFNFANRMANNLKPYKDFNMVTPPLLPLISQLFLRIFGKELIVMRVLASLMATSLFYIVFLIFNELFGKDKKNISFYLTLILSVCSLSVICIDYNWLVLLTTLILTLIELKRIKSTKEIMNYNFKYDLLIGLIPGIAIMFKQTTGLAISLACIGYKILSIKNKNDIKTFFKIAFTRALGALIPCILLLIYLLLNNILHDFIDYIILSVSTFSNKISYLSFISNNKGMLLLALIIPISIIFMFIKYIKSKDNTLLILFAYSAASFIVVYPIADIIHFIIGSMISMIALLYYGINLLIPLLKHIKKETIHTGLTILIVIEILLILSISLKSIIKYYNGEKNKEIKGFTNIIIPDYTVDSIKLIDEYIINEEKKGNKVVIANADASIYMIPINKFNNYYDLFLKGNLGKKSEKGIIELIEKNKDKNIIYLIQGNKLYRNWQTPEDVISYIQENLKRTGDIGGFDIYQYE